MQYPLRRLVFPMIVTLLGTVASAERLDFQRPNGSEQRPGQGQGPRPQRDAARENVPAGTASISGTVSAADTGRPLKRARVVIAGAGAARQARSTVSDERGRFQVSGLPAGTYTISATKTGYVDVIFGQRRAMRNGTPVQIADGQQLSNINLQLPLGGVITGRVLDEDGEPLARSAVSVLRYLYIQGERRLVMAGNDQSDDRGLFRVYGLPPGEYFVSAGGPMVERLLMRTGPNGFDQEATSEATLKIDYAPTYYPGTTTLTEASRIKLAIGQELAGIDLQLQTVPMATVRGMVGGASGGAMVLLVPDDGAVAGPAVMRGQGLRSATKEDGTFTITRVPPGRYTVVARENDGRQSAGAARVGIQPLTVAGEDVTVNLVITAGAQVSGTITLEATSTPVPKNFAGFRVNLAPLEGVPMVGRLARPGEPAEDGTFSITGLMPGRYVIRASGPSGWTMKSVFVNGREITDAPLDIKGDNVTDMNVVYTDRITVISGTVRDSKNAPSLGATVIAFPADSKEWSPQSRRIQAVRADQNGVYRIAALPPGEYLLVAVDDVEQGDWFDPVYLEAVKAGATRLTLAEGEQKTQDVKGS
jgi:hypothetical protein